MNTLSTGGMGSMSSMGSGLDRQTFGAQIVSKTLDTMNQPKSSMGMGMGGIGDFNFQTSVLTAGFTGKGGIADMNI